MLTACNNFNPNIVLLVFELTFELTCNHEVTYMNLIGQDYPQGIYCKNAAVRHTYICPFVFANAAPNMCLARGETKIYIYI